MTLDNICLLSLVKDSSLIINSQLPDLSVCVGQE